MLHGLCASQDAIYCMNQDLSLYCFNTDDLLCAPDEYPLICHNGKFPTLHVVLTDGIFQVPKQPVFVYRL